MLQFQSLTNVKPAKDLGSQLVAAPTPGQFKLTPDAASAMSVVAGDYLQILKAGEDFYAAKGEKGLGSKLSSATAAGGGTFNFSSANAWNAVDGSSEHNSHYDVDTEAPYTDENTGRVFFKLSFVERIEKQKKVKTSETANVAELVTEDTSEAPEVSNEVTSFDDI